MAPRARFELATLRLTAECSTVELPGNGQCNFDSTTPCVGFANIPFYSCFLRLSFREKTQISEFRGNDLRLECH